MVIYVDDAFSGKRLFKLWLCQPLSEASSINARLDAIDDFIANPSLTEDFGKATKGAPDLERLLSRIHAGSCKPSQFAKVLSSLSKISKTFASLAKTSNSLKSSALKSLLAGVPDLSDHLDAVREIYEEDEGMLVPKDGADEAFDQTGESIEEVETELQATLQKYRKELGLSSSEIKFKDIGSTSFV